MIQDHICRRCGSWKVILIGDRQSSQYYICISCGYLLENLDPKQEEKEKTAVEDLLEKTLAHERDTSIIHKK